MPFQQYLQIQDKSIQNVLCLLCFFTDMYNTYFFLLIYSIADATYFVSSGMCVVDSCPSPSVVYASVGDNITLCWKILPEANSGDLTRFTVMTLFRPVEEEMKKVASADKNGKFFRVFDRNHDGLYKKRVTVDADLQAGMLFLRMANYTNKMENVYCVLYEMSGSNDVQTCHSYAVLLRNIGKFLPGLCPKCCMSSVLPRSIKFCRISVFAILASIRQKEKVILRKNSLFSFKLLTLLFVLCKMILS